MLREVRLYGDMGRQFGRVHRFDIATPAEALRALRANHGRAFDAYLHRMRDAPFRILVGDEAADTERLAHPLGPEVVRIVPVIAGAGDDGKAIAGIVIGAALIYFAGPIGGALGSYVGGAGTITSAVGAMGVALVLGGVSSLLFRPPGQESQDRPDARPSYSFDGAVNTAGQGNPIPVGYGRLVVGGQTLSLGLFAEDF